MLVCACKGRHSKIRKDFAAARPPGVSEKPRFFPRTILQTERLRCENALGSGAFRRLRGHGRDGERQKGVQLKARLGALPDIVTVDRSGEGLVFHFLPDAPGFHARKARGPHARRGGDEPRDGFTAAQGVVKPACGGAAGHFAIMGANGGKTGLRQLSGEQIRPVQTVAFGMVGSGGIIHIVQQAGQPPGFLIFAKMARHGAQDRLRSQGVLKQGRAQPLPGQKFHRFRSCDHGILT